MRSVSPVLGFCLLATLTGGGAFAQSAPVTEATPPTFDWTGGYIGIQGGWSKGTFTKLEYSKTGIFSPVYYKSLFDYSADGFVGGAHIGYNWQIDQFVVGAEGDFELSTQKRNYSYSDWSAISSSQDWQASIRARAGFLPTERLLVYGTGGVAFTDITFTETHLPKSKSAKYNTIMTGWTVGAGAEYAFTDNLTARLEYRYTDFGKYMYRSKIFVGDDGEKALKKEIPQSHTVRVGLSYKF